MGAVEDTVVWLRDASATELRWQGRTGIFQRDVGDGEHAEIVITERVYRVRINELA